MKPRVRFVLSAALAGTFGAGAVRAQDAPPPQPAQAPAPPAAFATTFLGGGNFLGINPEEVTRENASRYGLAGAPRGVGVRSIVRNSPAERAGLRAGDVIVRFDGEEVTSVRKLTRLIDEAAPEHRARLSILRGGAGQEVAATLGRDEGLAPAMSGFGTFDSEAARRMAEELKRNSEQWRFKGEEWGKRLEELQRANPGGLFAVGAGGRRVGVSVEPLGRQLADYFGVSGGVLVESVEAGGPAEKAGLKAGDVITEVDGEKVSDGDDLPRLLNRKTEGEVTLTVVRERKSRTVRVTPEKRGAGLIRPGEFRLIAPPAVVAPPAGVIAPAAPRAPRVRPVTPRVQVWGRGRAI